MQIYTNIYLYNTQLGKDDFPNLKKIERGNLKQLYDLAAESDIFITDEYEITKLFTELQINLIYLGDKKISKVRSVVAKDLFELKNIVAEIMFNK